MGFNHANPAVVFADVILSCVRSNGQRIGFLGSHLSASEYKVKRTAAI